MRRPGLGRPALPLAVMAAVMAAAPAPQPVPAAAPAPRPPPAAQAPRPGRAPAPHPGPAAVPAPQPGPRPSPDSQTPQPAGAAAYGLPNGLEVRELQAEGAGTVRARLVLYIREGGGRAPEGTARLASRVLPLLGAGGTDRAAFEALKGRHGVLSQTDAGPGWASWTFESLPANAEMMIQLLADEALRPAWSRSEGLPEILARAWEEGQAADAGEAAARAFRAAAGDPAAWTMPDAPMDQDLFVALWRSAVGRPEGAVLSIVGDVESIPLRRAVAQHFGPWGGVRAGADPPAAPPAGEWPSARVVGYGSSAPQAWAAWDPAVLGAAEAAAIIPWLLKTALPVSDEVIQDLEIDPGGRWVRASGRSGASPERLEAHLAALLAAPVTQARLDAALAARDEHAAADGLHPGRMLERLAAPPTGPPPPPGELREALGRCMAPGALRFLVIAPPPP